MVTDPAVADEETQRISDFSRLVSPGGDLFFMGRRGMFVCSPSTMTLEEQHRIS